MAEQMSLDMEALVTDEEGRHEVRRADLPLHCPQDGATLWNAHPRVYLPIEASGVATCPYCGARYVLVDDNT